MQKARVHLQTCEHVHIHAHKYTQERIADLPLALERRIQKHLTSALLYYWHPQKQLD